MKKKKCIHCKSRPKSKGLYCRECHLAAKKRAAKVAQTPWWTWRPYRDMPDNYLEILEDDLSQRHPLPDGVETEKVLPATGGRMIVNDIPESFR